LYFLLVGSALPALPLNNTGSEDNLAIYLITEVLFWIQTCWPDLAAQGGFSRPSRQNPEIARSGASAP